MHNWPALIKDFKQFLLIKRGVNALTLQAYLSDLKDFLDWLGNKNLLNTTVNAYAKLLSEREYAKRTLARKLSSIRIFCVFLSQKGIIDLEPKVWVPAPKLGRVLPKVLTKSEIQSLYQVLPIDIQSYSSRSQTDVFLFYRSSRAELRFLETTPDFVSDRGRMHAITPRKPPVQ